MEVEDRPLRIHALDPACLEIRDEPELRSPPRRKIERSRHRETPTHRGPEIVGEIAPDRLSRLGAVLRVRGRDADVSVLAIEHEVSDAERKDPLLRGHVKDRPNTHPKRISTYLVRMIINNLNRSMSAAQISWVQNTSTRTVREIAKRLRAEGFKIPLLAGTGRRPITKLYKIIQLMKKENPDLLTDEVGCTLQIDNMEFHLNYREKKKLLAYLPRIAGLVRELPNRPKNQAWNLGGRKTIECP